ncbi:putative efflux protein, MATE family [Lutibacter oricola]|uniref:Putative efflux protein, MATE family n=1 Tax=Lutibacter oricola TaxID=762486 RepID=A0A1H2WUU4_9FLAO|nr:MATE family efflux transporter [Lutibacter oricola]SDW84390.1 putative efflux protein, MATE family [Lutibacter oricola]
MSKKINKNLTEGSIGKQLFSLTWPMTLGMLGMVIFTIIDTYFIGLLGVQQLAAISFCFPVIMFLNGLSMGIGIGTSSLISRNIIAVERSKVRLMSSRAILLGLVIVVVFVTAGINAMEPIFSSLGAKQETMPYIVDYMTIWLLGVPFVTIPMIGNNIVRATGDTKLPGMLMIASGVVNGVLDPLFIFGYGPFPELGIKGAALATVISRGISLILILIVLVKREQLLTIYLGNIKDILTTWKELIYVAIPASISLLITPISIGFITKIISGFGKEAVAAFGVASRVEMFALMVVTSLGSVLIIFVGQNISKLKFQRIFTSLNYSMVFSLIWGGVVFLILLLFGNSIASVFTNVVEVIEITKKYFYIIGASYGLQGLVILSTSSYNGINKPYPSAIFSLIRMLILYVPLAWIGARLFEINGVFCAGFIANIIVGIISYYHLNLTIKKISVS